MAMHKCTVTWTMTKLARMPVSNCKSDMDKVIDHSHLYTGYKDLNEYLMSHKTRK